MLNFIKKDDKVSDKASVVATANTALAWFDKPVGKSRRQRFQKRIDYYYGVQEKYLDEDIKSNFKYPDRIKLQKEFKDITRFITDELAIIYNDAPTRMLIDGSENDVDILSDIWEKSHIDLVMKTVNQLTKLCRTVAVKVSWRNDRIQYDIYTPNIFDVIPDKLDNTQADALIYADIVDSDNDSDYINNDNPSVSRDKFEDTDAIFYYWDKERFIQFKRSGNNKKRADVASLNGNPEYINPYKELPFVFFREGYPTDNFYIQGGDDLINGNSIINQKETEKNYLTKMQSFSQLVRKGAPEGAPDVIGDPSMVFDIPADSDINRNNDVKYITPEARIEELRNDIREKKRDIAINHKLDPDIFEVSRQRSSAESLQMQNANQARIIAGDKPFYSIYEQQLFEKTRLVYNTHNANKISDDCYLSIDYGDVETIMTIEEEDAHNIVMVNNGLMSKVDWIMSVNGDITTREEAIKRLQLIEDENKLLSPNDEEMPEEQGEDTEE